MDAQQALVNIAVVSSSLNAAQREAFVSYLHDYLLAVDHAAHNGKPVTIEVLDDVIQAVTDGGEDDLGWTAIDSAMRA